MVEKLSVFPMPKLYMQVSLYRSEQNEYSVDKAAVRRIGDILCKSVYLKLDLFFDKDMMQMKTFPFFH